MTHWGLKLQDKESGQRHKKKHPDVHNRQDIMLYQAVSGSREARKDVRFWEDALKMSRTGCTSWMWKEEQSRSWVLLLGPTMEQGRLPWGLRGKEPACNAGDAASIPGSGRFPWRRQWQATPVFLPGESHGQRSLVVYSPWGHKEWEWLSDLAIHVQGAKNGFLLLEEH